MSRALVTGLAVLALACGAAFLHPLAALAENPNPGCTDLVATTLGDSVRAVQAQPQPRQAIDLRARYARLDVLLGRFREEEIIISGSTCPSDEARAPIEAVMAGGEALALALQSDILQDLWAAKCPAASHDVPVAVLADAWLALAQASPDDGPVPPSVAAVVPQIQSRAVPLKLALPSFADTSDYWRRQLRAQADATVAACQE